MAASGVGPRGFGDPLTYTAGDDTLPDGLVLRADGTWSGGVLGLETIVVTVRACDPSGACAVLSLTLVGGTMPDTTTQARSTAPAPAGSVGRLWLIAAAFALAIAIGSPRRRGARRPAR